MVASNANQTPPQLAKRAATVDIISNGRLEFGIGAAAALSANHTAYGTPLFSGSGEYPAVGRKRSRSFAACGQNLSPILKGVTTSSRKSIANTKPVQKPTPPFVIGGLVSS